MARKLVSVITGTYNNPTMLLQAIENIRESTYPNIEHCIVSDGPDVLLRAWANNNWDIAGGRKDIPIKFVETGRQWSHFLQNSISAVPFQVAQWLASGDYIMWQADDERVTPEHIEKLVNLIETKNVDFVYSKSQMWFNYEKGLRYLPSVIGTDPPRNGQITQAFYRAELLDYCGFRTHVGSGTDWDQINEWMKAGATWAFLEECTHSHRVDKMGDGNARMTKQPLAKKRRRVVGL